MKICHISVSDLFNLITLNMCHKLRSEPGWFWPSLKSLKLSVPDLLRFYCWYAVSCCDLDLWLFFTLNLCSVGGCTTFQRNFIAIPICRIWGPLPSWIWPKMHFTIPALRGFTFTHVSNFCEIGQSTAELLVIHQIFLARFSEDPERAKLAPTNSSQKGMGQTTPKYGEDIDRSQALWLFFRFPIIAPFQNQSTFDGATWSLGGVNWWQKNQR